MLRSFACRLCCLACLTCGCATGTAAPSTVIYKDAGGQDAVSEEPADSGPLPEGAAGASPDAPGDALNDAPIEDQVSPPDVVETGPDAPVCDATAVINEIQTEGTVEPEDEFVELYNPGTCAVPMDEYSLYYRSATGTTDSTLWTAIAGQKLQPKAYFVLGGAKYSYGAADFTFAPGASLALAGGGLALKRNTKTIDMVGWGSAKNAYVDGAVAPAAAAGKSIARHPDGDDSDNNSVDFTAGTPTPRKTNN
ncbi:MAG: lamin tail domain-containing protein [Deltaproteobacteria bacterium]|nr:lamin tail domain-containing protein [Deltaproteobacteria bacterium]